MVELPMQSIKDIISNPEQFAKGVANRHKYVTKEFQDYGYRLALKLGDLPNVSLYIKLAKNKDRSLLESALSFAIDYPNAKNKGRLFVWRVKKLEEEQALNKATNKEGKTTTQPVEADPSVTDLSPTKE